MQAAGEPGRRHPDRPVRGLDVRRAYPSPPPMLVFTPQRLLWDGHRRVQAARLVGWTCLPAVCVGPKTTHRLCVKW